MIHTEFSHRYIPGLFFFGLVRENYQTFRKTAVLARPKLGKVRVYRWGWNLGP